MAFGSIGNFSGNASANVPLTTSGGMLFDTPGTVSHVYWNGTALVDTKGIVWTQNGIVPQVTSSPLLYDGQHMRAGAGPFSATNYYSATPGPHTTVANGANPVFSGVAVFSYTAQSTYPRIIDCTNGNVSGFAVVANYNNSAIFYPEPANNGPTIPIVGADATAGIHVFCFGRDSSGVLYAMLDGGTYTSQSGIVWTPAPLTNESFLGFGGVPWANQIYEVLFGTDPPSQALFQAWTNRVFGMLTAENQVLTVTR